MLFEFATTMWCFLRTKPTTVTALFRFPFRSVVVIFLCGSGGVYGLLSYLVVVLAGSSALVLWLDKESRDRRKTAVTEPRE